MPRITDDERERFHKYLDASIDKMERPKNTDKGHWSNVCNEYLSKKLIIEAHEPECAVSFEGHIEENEESYDVINYAMMIIDNNMGWVKQQ